MRSQGGKLAIILFLLHWTTGLRADAQIAKKKHDARQPVVAADATWNFAVSGDSRNCGDVVMPGIAAGVLRDHAAFYWHLGDLRWIVDIDQDFKQLANSPWRSMGIPYYERHAWADFVLNQVTPFGSLPFYLGIGNHETVLPKTRAQFVRRFSARLNTPVLKEQRLKDDPHARQVRTYYHWTRGGIDFINLDNASDEEFDADQLRWLDGVLSRDSADASIHSVVVGMHEALPESIAADHSMNAWPRGEQTGRLVYENLLKLRDQAHKKVYLLASHSHFFMDGVFNTEYWRTHGGVLSGWIIGTAGAVRYRLPPNASDANAAITDVYGYLLATVNPPGEPEGTIHFEFRELAEKDLPAAQVQRFTQPFVHECFAENRQ
jgi:hypothetical protein